MYPTYPLEKPLNIIAQSNKAAMQIDSIHMSNLPAGCCWCWAREREGRPVLSSRLEVGDGTDHLFHVSAIKCMHPVCPPSLLAASSSSSQAGQANNITVVRITPPRLVLWPLFPIQCPHCWEVIAYTLNPLCRPRILYPQPCHMHAYMHMYVSNFHEGNTTCLVQEYMHGRGRRH